MHYYALYNKNGRIVSKYESEAVERSEAISEITEAQYNSLDVAKAQKIFDLKAMLSETDYIAAKIAEGVATREEYADVIAQRQAWRDEINRLEET